MFRTAAKYTYDEVGRTKTITNSQNGAVVSSYVYDFDLNGNRIEQLEVNGGAEETTAYQYDGLDRLENIVYPDQTTSYTYDSAYNRQTEVVVANDGTTLKNWDYQYNQRHQLTDIVDLQDANQSITYTFDAVGNQTSKTQAGSTTEFVLDARDDIRQVLVGGSSVGQFLYDPSGLRIEKLGDRGVEKYTYDDQSVLLQYAVQGCTSAADAGCVGAASETNQTIAKFDWGPDRLLSLNHQTEGTQFYLTDALGSVVNLTHTDGSVQARYQYAVQGCTSAVSAGRAGAAEPGATNAAK